MLNFPFEIVLLFVSFAVALYFLLLPLARRRVNLADRIREKKEITSDLSLWESFTNFVAKQSKPLGQRLARDEKKITSRTQRLVQAGIRSRDSVFVLTGVRIILGTAAGLAFVTYGLYRESPLLYSVISVALAVALPDLWLSFRISTRKRMILWALPDFMDLALVCVEAGLGLDQAMQRVGRELQLPHPDLSDELKLYSLEVNAGKSRAEALRGLASRSGVDELRSFAALLIQADRFGTSIGQTLRVLAEDLRIRRRQTAEEMAAKLTVKLVVPLVIFVFPAILVITAGPAFIAIIRALSDVVAGGG